MDNGNETRVRRPSQARSIEKKDRIVQAAYDLFNRLSYQEVSIRLVARSAGVSIGTIYAYFQDKKGIFAAVGDFYRDEMYARFLKLIRNELDASITIEDAIFSVMRLLYDFFLEHEVFHRESFILSLMDEDHLRGHLVRERANGRAVVDLFYEKFGDRIAKSKTETVSFLVHRTVREIVQHQFLYREDIDEERIFRETAVMIAGYLRRPDDSHY